MNTCSCPLLLKAISHFKSCVLILKLFCRTENYGKCAHTNFCQNQLQIIFKLRKLIEQLCSPVRSKKLFSETNLNRKFDYLLLLIVIFKLRSKRQKLACF